MDHRDVNELKTYKLAQKSIQKGHEPGGSKVE
jgi:hypothetical protein